MNPPDDLPNDPERAWREGWNAALSLASAVVADQKLEDRDDEAECPECGADLIDALGGEVCPECGPEETP